MCVWVVNILVAIRIMDETQMHDSSSVIESIAQAIDKAHTKLWQPR